MCRREGLAARVRGGISDVLRQVATAERAKAIALESCPSTMTAPDDPNAAATTKAVAGNEAGATLRARGCGDHRRDFTTEGMFERS